MKKIIFSVYDVCGTLTHTNNTFEFLNFILKKVPLKFFLLRFFIFLNVTLNLVLKSSKIDKFFRRIAIKLMSGLSVVEVETAAVSYISEIYKNDLVNKKLEKIIKKDKHAILISSSISPPISALAKKLGVRFIATELEIKNGKYTGNIKLDYLDNKNIAISGLNLDFAKSSFYSNNFEDISLMKKFSNKFFITNNKLKIKHKLPPDFKIIELKKTLKNQDINSIDKNNVNFTLIPTFYYYLSRFHFKGLFFELILRIWIPLVLILNGYYRLPLLNSLLFTLLGYIFFFTLYEIGGYYNDLNIKHEINPTKRIKKGAKVNNTAFILIRILFLLLIIGFIKLLNLNYKYLFIGSVFTLLVYFLHTTLSKMRILTFSLLKVLRAGVPLLIFYGRLPNLELFYLFILLFIFDGFFRIVYYYNKKRKNNFSLIKYPLLSLIGILMGLILERNYFFLILLYLILLKLFEKLYFKHNNF